MMEISTHGRRVSRAVGLVGAAGLLAASGGLLAAPAFAASSTGDYVCDNGSTLTVMTHDNHASDKGGWGAGTVVDGGSGKVLPTSFSIAAHDDTAGQYLFQAETAKGGGNANHNQSQITCWQSTTATLGDLLAQEGPPPGGLPDWAQLTDTVTMTFTVTAVPRG